MSRDQPKGSSYVPPLPNGTRVHFGDGSGTVVALRKRKKFARRYLVRETSYISEPLRLEVVIDRWFRRDELAVTP